MSEQRFLFGQFMFDPGRGTLSRDGDVVPIGHRALSVLHALLKAQGQVVTKAELMAFAWPDAVVEESNLSVQIAALRKLLSQASGEDDWIATVARVGYRFAGTVVPCEGAADEPGRDGVTHPAAKPSLAVLPFDNLSGDADQEYFADGVTEDIIAALSRFRWFFVMARNASFTFKRKAVGAREVAQVLGVRYVLAGSVRKSANRMRISAQLIDAQRATQLWADHYDFELGELLSVQDDIAQQVVGAIEPELLRTESTLAVTHRGRRDMTGWDLVHQGTWYFHQVTRSTHLRARDLFREACKADPQLAEAHAWLGRVSAGIVAYGWSDDEASDLREGIGAALRAVQIDDKNPYAHYALAITSVYDGNFGQAVRAGEMAIELSPGFALGHLVLGMACLFSGHASQAAQSLERGLRLNPHDPQNFVWHNILALAHLFERRHERALQCAVTALKVRPNWQPAMETAACCYQALGRGEAARECVERLARCDTSSADALAPLKRANPRWHDEMKRLLHDAGWQAEE
jgi:TolB-like protein